VVTGYENIRRLTHECLLPALERCGVLLSRLQGLSRFQNSSQLLGLETRHIADCLAVVDCLNLLGHQLLLQSGLELRQFICFAKWLRQEIDFLATGPTSSSADDSAEQSENIDYARVLDYIQGAMTKSRLLNFFRDSAPESVLALETADGSSLALYNEYKEALEHSRTGGVAEDSHTLRLNDLTENLRSHCRKVFAQIAETQKRSILVSSPLSLSKDSDPRRIDMRMCVNVRSIVRV
jgi:anaphase-promoting complex subunit 4